MTSEASTSSETVVDETINAYRVQKLENGDIRIESGGHVATAETYFEALKQYADGEQHLLDKQPKRRSENIRRSIYDGSIPLKSFDSGGFRPERILDEVTGQPLDTVLEDISLGNRGGSE